jgi:hypothetical protein
MTRRKLPKLLPSPVFCGSGFKTEREAIEGVGAGSQNGGGLK